VNHKIGIRVISKCDNLNWRKLLKCSNDLWDSGNLTTRSTCTTTVRKLRLGIVYYLMWKLRLREIDRGIRIYSGFLKRVLLYTTVPGVVRLFYLI